MYLKYQRRYHHHLIPIDQQHNPRLTIDGGTGDAILTQAEPVPILVIFDYSTANDSLNIIEGTSCQFAYFNSSNDVFMDNETYQDYLIASSDPVNSLRNRNAAGLIFAYLSSSASLADLNNQNNGVLLHGAEYADKSKYL